MIKTAEECLNNNILEDIAKEGYSFRDISRKVIIKSMQDYAQQFIDLAAQRARIKLVSAKSGYGKLNASGVEIDKMSILRIKEEIN